MKNEVFIFDIDGCILPNLFENYGWAKDQSREEVIREVNHHGRTAKLFPNFVKYFGEHCKNALKIYFITGRQEEEFKKLTLQNLEELLQFEYDFTIVWYPPNKKHTTKTYFRWKIATIKTIMKGYQNASKKRGLDVKFIIFDDLSDYFTKLLKFRKKRDIDGVMIEIKTNEQWGWFVPK